MGGQIVILAVAVAAAWFTALIQHDITKEKK